MEDSKQDNPHPHHKNAWWRTICVLSWQNDAFVVLFNQSGQIAESGSQTRLPDAAVLPTMLYSWYVLNLNLKLDFNTNLAITVWFFELETTSST